MIRYRFVLLLVLGFAVAACDMRGSPSVVESPDITSFEGV